MWRDSESNEDFLNFSEIADQIATLATSPSLLPVSIGVFGTWGTGKSTVLRLVKKQLAEADPAPIIIEFDAWLYQGYDDAKAALMEVVADRLLAEAKGNESLLDKAKRFAGRINYFRALGMAADVGVGMALGVPPGLLTRAGNAIGALVSGQVGAAEVDTVKEAGKVAADTWSNLIKPEEARTPPKEIAAFRQEFGEILKDLKRPLLVFIDNLDRCLPDVAIGTLEAIRLFLFIEGTSFVIAADEDMIRHSVAKHFSDPNARHVHDYLDKVIQVPFRVPQTGTEDVRAYMYSLFVSLHAPSRLVAVQAILLKSLQESWKGKSFTRDEIAKVAGNQPALLDALSVCDRLAPILATAPAINGNPRIVKRLLNAITLRQTLAGTRQMTVDLATLAKLAVFERATDSAAALKLYNLVMTDEKAAEHLRPLHTLEGTRPDLPAEWKSFEAFIERWREMEPYFEDAAKLRPAVFLSRDVMAANTGVSGLSAAVGQAVDVLMAVTTLSSQAGKRIVEGLSPADQKATMGQVIGKIREADWTKQVPGVHGAIVLARVNKDCEAEFKAFLSGLKLSTMSKPVKALLEASKMTDKGP
jgi:predicted KAP-like P-loop ATPase